MQEIRQNSYVKFKNMKIPFVDLKKQYHSIKTDIDIAINNVIETTSFIGGSYVNEFENSFAKLYGIKHCISVANGTDSLYIIMKMIGIGYGDEVITVANSWISSSETISQTGAKPVFVDIDCNLYTINEDLIESKITKNTKAILIVHLFGQVCDLNKVNNLAIKYNLKIIEDCAQSHFSEFNSQRVGTFGIAGSFSFYPGKNLGAYGDAGCIITNDDQLAEKCKMYARHGALIKHKHQIEGINSRMDGIQAAILLAKLPYILDWTEKRIKNSLLYNKYLFGINEIVIPEVRSNSKHTFHLYVIRANNRTDLIKYLSENGIETAIHYPTILPSLKAYEYLNNNLSDFIIASNYQSNILSLPMYPELEEEQIYFVCQKIKEFYSIYN
jgi:dTDP-4-amino-4,6-dideoxygalactose transaminase